MLTDHQQEIYDIIMNDEFCYSKYQNEKFNSAIKNAIRLSQSYGYPINLTAKEFKQLKKYLQEELESEE